MLMLTLLNDSGNSCTPQVEMKAVVNLSKKRKKKLYIQNIIKPLLEEVLLLQPLLQQPSLTSITQRLHVLVSPFTQSTVTDKPRSHSAVAGCCRTYRSAFTGRRLQWIIMKISKATNKADWRASWQASRCQNWNWNEPLRIFCWTKLTNKLTFELMLILKNLVATLRLHLTERK